MPNGLCRSIYVSIICCLAPLAHAEQILFNDKPPQREQADPQPLLELTAEIVARGRGAAVTVNKTAIGRGQPLQIVVDGQTIEYTFERIVQASDSVTWIGRHRTQGRIYVTISQGVAYVDLNASGRPVQIAFERGAARVIEGAPPGAPSEERAYRKHRRAIALDRLSPSSLRQDDVSGRITRIRAGGLGRVNESEFVPSSNFKDALGLGHELDIRERSRGAGELSAKWAYKTYDQYLNNIRVRSTVRLIYNRWSSEVTGVLSTIYSAEDAPKPTPGDISADAAQPFAIQELTDRYGLNGSITASAPQLVYEDVKGQLRLGWVMRLTHRGAPYDAFVDVKTGKAAVLSMAMPTHTCSANGTNATTCTDTRTTPIIGSNGQCLNSCGSPLETAHRESVRLYEEALSRYQQRGFVGYENNLDSDIEIVTDTTGLQNTDSLAETYVDPSDFEARILVRDMNLASDAEVMYHETAHIYTASKNEAFIPTSNMEPGTFSLNESFSYILDEISRGTTAGLQHQNAHINNYVDDFDHAAQNAQILSQAFYKLISTPNNVDIQMAEKLLLRAVPLMTPCTSNHTPAQCLWELKFAVRDVLDMMDDEDEVTGPQETAISQDFYVAMGSVGLGHLAQPPGGTPPVLPVPSTPFLIQEFYACANGYSWWELWWAPVQHADSYPVFRDFEYWMGTDTIPPGYFGAANANADVHIHACGSGGCSGHSNSVYVEDICQ